VNRDDTIDLLTAIAARDQRTVGQADVMAWANDLADVTLSDALDATTAFNQSEAALHRRIVAADIVQWVRHRNRGRVEQEHTSYELARARAGRERALGSMRALPAGGVTGVWDGRPESASLRELWGEVLPVGCPPRPKGCSALAGERCTNPHTGAPTKIPHPGRMKAAESFSQP
jgi:hypothetical protein